MSNRQIFKGFLAWYQKRYFWWKIPIFPAKCCTVQCISVENYIFSSNDQILRKMTYFKKRHKMNIFQWNYRFQWFQWIFKREPSTVCCTCLKYYQNDWNEQIPRKLKKYHILTNFQKRALYRLQFLHRKLLIFSEITDSKEIKDISDFD